MGRKLAIGLLAVGAVVGVTAGVHSVAHGHARRHAHRARMEQRVADVCVEAVRRHDRGERRGRGEDGAGRNDDARRGHHGGWRGGQAHGPGAFGLPPGATPGQPAPGTQPAPDAPTRQAPRTPPGGDTAAGAR